MKGNSLELTIKCQDFLSRFFHDIVICIRRYLFYENASGQEKRYAILMKIEFFSHSHSFVRL